MAISMLKIRRPLGRLIFNMGIAIAGKTVFLIETAPWFNVDMSSYRYRKSHCRAKAVVIWSYLHNGIFYCGKIESLCWIVPLVTNYYKTHPSMNIDYNSRIFPNWKPKVVLKPTLSSLVAPAVVITTTAAPTSDHQVGIITTLGCQCM